MTNDSLALALKVRNHVLDMTSRGGSSHVGSALSIVDILSVLYSFNLVYSPETPLLPHRDRFILSKGHAGCAVYATLAESGFFSIDLLSSHYRNGSSLSGHVSHKNIPGVEFSTGSLGHGFPVACGIAYALMRSSSKSRVFCLLSDGELDEGSNWESFLFASHSNLSNLMIILDYNKLQSLGSVSSTLELEPLVDKFLAFNFNVIECDGHNHEQLKAAFDSFHNMKPTIVICHTVKGKGVAFMENSVLWHYRSPQGEEYQAAKKSLNSTSL